MKFKLETVVDLPFERVPKVITIDMGFADGCRTTRKIPRSHVKPFTGKSPKRSTKLGENLCATCAAGVKEEHNIANAI